MAGKSFTLYKDFTEDYLIVEIPKVCAYLDFMEITDYLMSDGLFWKNVDLFIYQTVRRDNRCGEKVATDGILSRLKSNDVKVNILNVYFAGYFPQITAENDRILHEFHSGGLFPFRDKYIDDMLHLGMSADANQKC